MYWKYSVPSVLFFVLVSLCLAQDPKDICPPNDLIEPCYCQKDFQSPRAIVRCEKVTGTEVIVDVLNRSSEYQYEYLIIEDSSISYIPQEAFSIKRLARLYIFSTTMISLFQSPPESSDLQAVSFYKLKLSRSIQWDLFTNTKNIKNFTVEHSPIRNLDQVFVDNAPKGIERLTINNCSLSKLHDQAFSLMEHLIEVIIQGNKIKELKRSMFPSSASELRRIDFSKNQIQALPEDLFTDMPLLYHIRFDDNLISDFAENTYIGLLDHLLSLSMENNPIKCLCKIRWIFKIDPYTSLWRNLHGSCAEPKALHGQRLNDLREGDFAHC
ncbi:uncharacterized protein CDAR_177821 [Caerostris darwini]|uniref:Uncharacterized protein n=1 Tax=Caerostris darwini TaxID=1538125 RepID=A0AAV4TC17_9ARAC|nr:uncharacterized protein CDAR_177821 [Caerostris darwini]